MNVTSFRRKIFADNQVKTRFLGWALIIYDCVLIKKEFRHRDMCRGKTV